MAATAVSISKAMLVRSCGALNQLLSSESKTDAELIGDFSLNAANVACHEDDHFFSYIYIYLFIYLFILLYVFINIYIYKHIYVCCVCVFMCVWVC